MSRFDRIMRFLCYVAIPLIFVLSAVALFCGKTEAGEMPASGQIGGICRNVHVITFEVREEAFSLNPFTHLKNEMNATAFMVPVTEDYFNQVKEGEEVLDDFRYGSLILKGNFGNWSVSVKKKEVMEVCK